MSGSPAAGAPAEKPSVGEQVRALLILLPVFGALFLLFHYLPGIGDRIGAVADRVTTSDSDDRSGDESAEWTTDSDPSEPARAPVEGAASDGETDRPGGGSRPDAGCLDSYRAQIVEQLGGPDRVEVRHLAASDDGARLVAAVRFGDGDGEGPGPRLLEIYFERDEFGRFLSEDSEFVDERLTLWSE